MKNSSSKIPSRLLIEAAVLGVNGYQVSIRTDASEDVTILREELLESGTV
mgnify:CR=1 FL=1